MPVATSEDFGMPRLETGTLGYCDKVHGGVEIEQDIHMNKRGQMPQSVFHPP